MDKTLFSKWPPPAFLSAGRVAIGFTLGALADVFHLPLSLLHARRISSFPDLLFAALADLLPATLILMNSFPNLLLLPFLEFVSILPQIAALFFKSLLLILPSFAHLIFLTLAQLVKASLLGAATRARALPAAPAAATGSGMARHRQH